MLPPRWLTVRTVACTDWFGLHEPVRIAVGSSECDVPEPSDPNARPGAVRTFFQSRPSV
jgi:hypothetical protein